MLARALDVDLVGAVDHDLGDRPGRAAAARAGRGRGSRRRPPGRSGRGRPRESGVSSASMTSCSVCRTRCSSSDCVEVRVVELRAEAARPAPGARSPSPRRRGRRRAVPDRRRSAAPCARRAALDAAAPRRACRAGRRGSSRSSSAKRPALVRRGAPSRTSGRPHRRWLATHESSASSRMATLTGCLRLVEDDRRRPVDRRRDGRRCCGICTAIGCLQALRRRPRRAGRPWRRTGSARPRAALAGCPAGRACPASSRRFLIAGMSSVASRTSRSLTSNAASTCSVNAGGVSTTTKS